MELNDIKPAPGAKKNPRRVGRGIGASKGAKEAIEKAGGSVAALVAAEPVRKLAKKAKPAPAK